MVDLFDDPREYERYFGSGQPYDMRGYPQFTKEGKRNKEEKTGDEYEKDAVAYKVFFNKNHSDSHATGWFIYIFALICSIVGIGLVGGLWSSIPDSSRTESFKNYCYSLWAVLGLGVILVTSFIIYFYYIMRQFKLKHVEKFNNVFKK